jgi:hypothetical protein
LLDRRELALDAVGERTGVEEIVECGAHDITKDTKFTKMGSPS